MDLRCAVVIPSIESVLGQSRRSDRFLVVDDGSGDGWATVVESYAGRGVELIRQ